MLEPSESDLSEEEEMTMYACMRQTMLSFLHLNLVTLAASCCRRFPLRLVNAEPELLGVYPPEPPGVHLRRGK